MPQGIAQTSARGADESLVDGLLMADEARRFGLTTRIETNPSMALGSNSVRLIDMTRAYATFANRGLRVDGSLTGDSPRVIEQVRVVAKSRI